MCSNSQGEPCGKGCPTRGVTLCHGTQTPKVAQGGGITGINATTSLHLSIICQGSPLANPINPIKSNKNQRTQRPIDVDHEINIQKVQDRSTGQSEDIQEECICLCVCMWYLHVAG